MNATKHCSYKAETIRHRQCRNIVYCSASRRRISLLTGLSLTECWAVGLSRVALAIRSDTDRTHSFLSSMLTPTTLAIGHWFRGRLSSFIKTISLTWKFLDAEMFLVRGWRDERYSLFHRVQNSFAMCCTRLHLRLQYKSGLSKTPGGGCIALRFIVNRWLGVSGHGPSVSIAHWLQPRLLLEEYETTHRPTHDHVASTMMTKWHELIVFVFPKLLPYDSLMEDCASTWWDQLLVDLKTDWLIQN